ncbi:MAG: response regulator, partial [Deltaproteobacteria bacterium]
LRARAVNLEYVDQALRLATAEVAEAARYTEAKARQTIGLAWLALALFVIVGATGGILLSRSVRTIAQDFEDAAAEVGEQRDRLRAVMEEMEATRDAALEASRIKSEFLANMSHEIRTPMNAIIGFTDLVLETALGAEQRDYLGHVRQSSEALLAIINEVLDLSKIEAGRLRLDSTPFSVRHTLDAALSGMAIRADEKNLELAVDVRPEVPDAAIGDASRMRQVLVNLVGNAIKFTERGQVVVHVTTEPHTDAAEVVLHFSVADTGIGIPADKHRVVFDAFRQGDGSMTRRYEGTGLGLTIASRLVEMMGGRIWLESVVGQGTTFHFTARVGLQQQVAHLPPNLSTLAGLRVLVVDDSATVRSILMGMLESWSMSAVAADDGEVALAALREARETEHPFALALLDARMPGMDGFDLARRLAAEPGIGETKLILLTALNRPDEAPGRHRPGEGRGARRGHPRARAGARAAPRARRRGQPDEPAHADRSARESRTCRRAGGGWPAGHRRPPGRVLRCRPHGRPDAPDGRAHRDGIIALTAHAMKGDRERCIAAGMDAYVSKPVYAEELFGVMESVVEGAGAMRFDAGRSDASVVDVDALLRQVGGNRAAFAEVLDLFREDSARMLDALRSALATRDGSALEHTAHQLRGALMVMAAPGAAAAALRLEEIGREQDFRSAPEAWARLTNELDRLEPGLAALGGRAKEETTS